MDKETKELRAIANFYKDTKRGFATRRWILCDSI